MESLYSLRLVSIVLSFKRMSSRGSVICRFNCFIFSSAADWISVMMKEGSYLHNQLPMGLTVIAFCTNCRCCTLSLSKTIARRLNANRREDIILFIWFRYSCMTVSMFWILRRYLSVIFCMERNCFASSCLVMFLARYCSMFSVGNKL